MRGSIRENILRNAAQRVSSQLRVIGNVQVQKKSLHFKSPPLVLPHRDDQLDEVRHPESCAPGDLGLVAFELLVDAWQQPRKGAWAEIRQALGDEVCQVLSRYPCPEQRLIVALWCLGDEPHPARYDDESITIDAPSGTYGIHKGRVLSRFNEGLEVSLNPRQVLETSHRVTKSQLPAFVSALGSARKTRDRELERTLTILIEEMTRGQFTCWVSNNPLMTLKERLRLEHDIFNRHDPLGVIYKKIVPQRMTRSEFCKVFGSLSSRNLKPNNEQRQVILNKLSLQPFFT